MIPMMMLPCRFEHKILATGIWYFNKGCACFPDHIQALCDQHAVNAAPIDEMVKLIDLRGVNGEVR